MEAMKMEHSIVAKTEGVVKTIHYVAGEFVESGAVLVTFE
jgi:biotin carboxyl carrier protein